MTRLFSLIVLLAALWGSSAWAENCQTLWTQRNTIFKDAGYCFKTARAIAAFGNAGCKYDSLEDVPLSEIDRQAVQSISRQEAAQRCEVAEPPSQSITARCRVTDPTNTPLNVRTAPNGKIVSALQNGTLVSILDQTVDREGKPWVYIGTYRTNEPIGWVYREYLSCF
jgi:hypothetical protein